MATFCDVLMPLSVRYQGDGAATFLPTVSLSLDYLAPARFDAWVEGRTEVLRTGKSLVFAQALLTADGVLVVRASGVFSVPQRSDAPALPLQALKGPAFLRLISRPVVAQVRTGRNLPTRSARAARRCSGPAGAPGWSV